MNFCLRKNTIILLMVLSFITVFQTKNYAQTCPTSWNEWQWPTHSNWFVGWSNRVSFGASGTAAPAASDIGAGAWAPVYESTAAASDNDGNLVLFTNGVKLFDGTGAEIAVPGGRLLTGSETTVGDAGSAVQGVFIARHPLDVDNYYIFTTDDAILGAAGTTYGFNYYIYNQPTNSVSAATRLRDAAGGNFRCTEQIAATFHANGVDVWISTHASTAGGSTKYLSYLLTCNGLEEVPEESNGDFIVLANTANERASLQFSWDGTKAGATYHNGGGTWDPDGAVTLLDFDNLTGLFSNPQAVSPNDANHSNPYDCEFSPSGNRLFVSYQCLTGSEIGYVDVGSGAYTAAINFDANECGALKTGGDGRIYTGTFRDCAGWAYGNSVGAINNPDGVPTYNGDALMTPNNVGWGLGNMFIAPRDWLEIQDPGALTECDLPVDLETIWECKTTDAENTPRYENAYSLATVGPYVCAGCSVDPVTGEFNAPAAGTYEVHFTICDIADTLIFNVGVCGCDAEVGTADPICAGETFLLDSTVKAASGDGVWTVDSVPTTPGIDAVIDDSGADTIFDASASNVKYGVYKLMFRVDGSCEDSLYIEVKKIPTVTLQEEGPFCDDSVAVNLTATPVIDGISVTGAWQIDNNLPNVLLPGQPMNFDPVALGPGTYKVLYGVDSLGCQSADSINILVKERPHPEIQQVGPYCANDPAVNLTIIPASGDTGVWSGEADALGRFTPSNSGAGDHDIFYTIDGQCGNDTTIQIHVDAVKDATIATPDTTICKSDPAVALTTGDLTGIWYVNDTVSGVGNELGGTSFDPASYPAGVYDLIYHLSDPCGDLDTVVITVNPDLDASITSGNIDYCNVDTVFNLTTTNPGGVWYKNDTLAGSELGGTTLNPTDHTGAFKIYYYMPGMCGDVDSIDVNINPLKDATINTPEDTMSLCVLDPNPTFTVADNTGTWNNPAVSLNGAGEMEIDLASMGIVVNEMLIYSVANPCGDKDTIWVTTTNQLDATITPVGPFCDDADSVRLSVIDAGGTFSGGTWVDPVTGWFDPIEAGDGVHRVTYTIGGNCGDVQFIDITVNRTPDPTITNIDTVQCENYGDIALTTVEIGGTWEDVDNTKGGLNTGAGLFNTETAGFGTYRIRYGFPLDACPAFDTITMIVIEEPTVNLSGPDTLCDDEGIQALVSSFIPIAAVTAWTGGDGAGNFDPAGNWGDNAITLSADHQGCTIDSIINIHVLERADASILPAGPYCHTDAALQLYPQSPIAVGTWSGTGMTGNTFDPGTAGAGTHTITFDIGGRCPDTKTIDIVVNGAPDATIQAVAPVCPGDAVINFNPATPGGVWTGDVEADGTFNPTTPGIYEAVYILFDPCFNTDTLEFEVFDIPETMFDGVYRDCAPLEATFTDVSDEVPVQSFWDFGNSATSNDASGVVSNPYETVGSFDVTLRNIYANGCESDYTFQAVTTYETPSANFTWEPQTLDVDNNQAVFTSTSSADVAALQWDFSQVVLPTQSTPITTASPDSSNEPVQEVIFNSSNGDIVNVSLIVSNANGCTDTIVKPVTILDKFSLYIPNAFTPNDDGTNDEFFPLGRNLIAGENYEFRVYNRWGTLIWMTNDPTRGWDGRVTELAPSGGEIAQIDVYVWRLVVVDPFTGEDHKLVGRVSLVK